MARFRALGGQLRNKDFDAGDEEFLTRLIQIALDCPDEILALQTPKEYLQQLVVAAEALRRSRTVAGDESRASLLDQVRALMKSPTEESDG